VSLTTSGLTQWCGEGGAVFGRLWLKAAFYDYSECTIQADGFRPGCLSGSVLRAVLGRYLIKAVKIPLYSDAFSGFVDDELKRFPVYSASPWPQSVIQ
jgi:hypothetical protein